MSTPLHTPPGFDRTQLARLNTGAVQASKEYRRAITRLNPLIFTLLYLPHHLRSPETNNKLSLSQFHIDIAQAAQRWTNPNLAPAEIREAWIAPRGSGKALALDTPVLTANRGWTVHGDLTVADRVFDERGQQCNVVWVSPVWPDRTCYQLTFSDGSQVVADSSHEWFVSDRYRTRPGIQTTAEIASKWLLTNTRGFNEVRYSIPTCGSLQYPPAALPISPYVLGAWLGDGTSGAGQITVGVRDAEDMTLQLKNEGENPNLLRSPSSAAYSINLSKPRPHLCRREHLLKVRAGTRHPCQICISQHAKFHKHAIPLEPSTNQPLIVRLRDANLLHNKHIPKVYFSASHDQRLALLQGLMDTDGTIALNGACEFTNMNERLSRDILRLLTTVGIKAKLASGRATIYGVDKGTKWRVAFFTELPVFRLERKAQRVGPIRAGKTRRIVAVDPAPNQPTNCIQVDSPSHQYLVGESLISTHNSTWAFLALPLWAMAHHHRRFVTAFSHSTRQARRHLANLKRELETNKLLRNDYPTLCTPKKLKGRSDTDTQDLYLAASGVAMMAQGIDASSLGTMVNGMRPSLLCLDDVEPDESNYSIREKEKRLATIINSVLGMNPNAVTIAAGTTVMYGSIMHDLVRAATTDDVANWIREERITTRYYPAITVGPDGEQSWWPQRWTLEQLQAMRHTRAFQLNFQNQPPSTGGAYWNPEDIPHGPIPGITERVLWVDGAVTHGTTSDDTGMAVVGYSPSTRRTLVEYAQGFKLTPAGVRGKVSALLGANPSIRLVLVEANQGGEMWRDVLSPLPAGVRVELVHSSESKPVRFQRVLDYYQQGWVSHLRELPRLEEQMLAFPNVAHDDVLDAVCGGVHHFLVSRRRVAA